MSVKVSTTERAKASAARRAVKSTDANGRAGRFENGIAETDSVVRRLHRLALDVHDGPMQNLTAIGFGFAELRKSMRGVVPLEHQPRLDADLARIATELGKVEHDLRALVTALEGESIESVPLRDAIASEIAEFERSSGIEVAFACDEEARAETDSQRIALQSVTRAALANVAKHADASRVDVRLTRSADLTTLEIEDDGRGFRVARRPKPGRMGLSGMKRRVELLGGEFHIDSRPGGPTTVTASLRAWRPDDD